MCELRNSKSERITVNVMYFKVLAPGDIDSFLPAAARVCRGPVSRLCEHGKAITESKSNVMGQVIH